MKIKLLHAYRNKEYYKSGQELDLEKKEAELLINKGKAIKVVAYATEEKEPENEQFELSNPVERKKK